jgi:hypothetical protein
MLGFHPKPKSTEEEIKKQKEVWLQSMLEKSQKLNRMIKSEQSGWVEFCGLLREYIESIKKIKAFTSLDKASDEDIRQLKLLDREVYILSWVLRIPEQFIGQVEADVKKENK